MTTWIACLAGLLVSQWAVADGRAGTWETRLGVAFTNSASADFEGGTNAEYRERPEPAPRARVSPDRQHRARRACSTLARRDYKANIAGDTFGEFFHVKGDLDFTTLMFDGTWNMHERIRSARSSSARSAGAGSTRTSQRSHRRPAAGGIPGGVTSAARSRTRARSTGSRTSWASAHATTSTVRSPCMRATG